MNEGNHEGHEHPTNLSLDALHSLYGSTQQEQQQPLLAGYLNQASNDQHPAQLQQLQLLQSLMQQQQQQQQQHPTQNHQFHAPLLQPYAQQATTRSLNFDSIRSAAPATSGVSPTSLGRFNSDLQAQLLRSLSNPPASSQKNNALRIALEKHSILERARALNEIEIRRALGQEPAAAAAQQGQSQSQSQAASLGILAQLNSSLFGIIQREGSGAGSSGSNQMPSSFGSNDSDSSGQYIQIDTVARPMSPISDEANGSDDSANDNTTRDRGTTTQSSSLSAPLHFAAAASAAGEEGSNVRDLRMVQDSTWESRFKDLVQFKQEHGHCNVPRRYKANPKLGVWVCSVRQQMARGTLNKAKMERLNELDFQWRITVIKGGQINPQIAKSDQWIENFQHLKSIKERTGECAVVPATNRKLCKWIDRQRREMNKGKLPMEKQEKLNSIGFQWKPASVSVE
ncbi:unnamed protein product [Cylindrotheca closterium]|uniref:Helicase-associated domain-containing protein n=1 Tax=Cylindrotheca closterium TaxID=2856 RepID=A0AAD2CT07_9STRA|nr:unnamed protein product [Cylindrotheca closterium]